MLAQCNCCNRNAQQRLCLSVLALSHRGCWLESHGALWLTTAWGSPHLRWVWVYSMHSRTCIAPAHRGSPTIALGNKNHFSFLTQELRYGEAFLSSVVSLGILPWEAVNFLKSGARSCMAESVKYWRVGGYGSCYFYSQFRTIKT